MKILKKFSVFTTKPHDLLNDMVCDGRKQSRSLS